MTLRPPTFNRGATPYELYEGAFAIMTEHEALAYMQGLMDYFVTNYPAYYGKLSRPALRLRMWGNLKAYAKRQGLPMAGLHRFYKIPAKVA